MLASKQDCNNLRSVALKMSLKNKEQSEILIVHILVTWELQTLRLFTLTDVIILVLNAKYFLIGKKKYRYV